MLHVLSITMAFKFLDRYMYSMYTTTCVVTTFAVNVYRVFILNIYVIKLLGKLNISYDHNLSAKGLSLF